MVEYSDKYCVDCHAFMKCEINHTDPEKPACENIQLHRSEDIIDIPDHYELVNEHGIKGTYKIEKIKDKLTDNMFDFYKPICYNATYVTKVFIDPLTGMHYLNWVFEYKGNKIENIVNQKDLLTAAGIKNLTALGLNVPESMVRPLCEYFGNFINSSSTIEEKNIYSKFGWVNNDKSFVIGNTQISKTDCIDTYLTKDVLNETIDSFKPCGTAEGWLDAVRGLLQYNNVRFVCYTAITALLLKHLNGASFVVELIGDTSIGKTVTAQLAMSCVGDPENLKLATSATKTFIERTCATCNDLPIYLDETSAMDSSLLIEIIYMVESGRGRGRAKKDGGVNEVDKWKSVLLTTGEVPLTNMVSLGGQSVRIVTIYGGIGADDELNVLKFKENIKINYGVIAPLIIQKILSEKRELKKLFERIRLRMKEYSTKDQTGTMNRVVDTYAIIALAGSIFESVMDDLGENPVNAIDLVGQMFCDKIEHSDGSLSDRAYAIINDWITENRRCFKDNREGAAGDRYGLYGNISMSWVDGTLPYDYVDIIPTKLSEILDRKFDHVGISKQILRLWKRDGIVICDGQGKTQKLATIESGGKQIRVVRLKYCEHGGE